LTDKTQHPVEAYIKRLKGAETEHNLDSWELSSFGRHRHPSHLSFSFFFYFLSFIIYYHVFHQSHGGL